jgi:CheY-like chemotaxis protein
MPLLTGMNVLLVEDDDDTREALRLALVSRGALVTAAAGAKEALAAVQRALPDVVVSDIAMPDEDGYAFLRKLRSLKPERGGRVPAVALTAFGSREARELSRECGFHYHLEKPIDPAKLADVLLGLVRLTRR